MVALIHCHGFLLSLTTMLFYCFVVCVSELESGAERAHHIQQIITALPRTVIIVMRYLFAFLNQWVTRHDLDLEQFMVKIK